MPRSSTKKSAIKTFFQENKSLAFMLPLLIVLVIALILIYSGNGDTGNAAPVSSVAASPTPSSGTIPEDQPKVEVLPQIVRKATSQDETGSTNDPFQDPMKLSGILTNSKGEAIAIIESAGSSYIVRTDEYIGDSSWKVKSIYESSVMLDNNGESLLLKLESSPQ